MDDVSDVSDDFFDSEISDDFLASSDHDLGIFSDEDIKTFQLSYFDSICYSTFESESCFEFESSDISIPSAVHDNLNRKRSRSQSRNSSDSCVYNDEKLHERSKLKRQSGSYGRVIINTCTALPSVIDEAFEIGQRVFYQSRKSLQEANDTTRKDVLERVFESYNLGDMGGLAGIIQENFSDDCRLSSPDLTDEICGKADLMSFFSLMFENYPDGIYRPLPGKASIISGNIASTTYNFIGTRVFDQPFNALFLKVKGHWKKVHAYEPTIPGCFLDDISYSWIPEAPIQCGTTPCSWLSVHSKLGEIPSGSASKLNASSKDERRGGGGPLTTKNHVAATPLQVGSHVSKFMSTFGVVPDNFIMSLSQPSRVCRLKRRMDFEFDVSNRVTRIFITSVDTVEAPKQN